MRPKASTAEGITRGAKCHALVLFALALAFNGVAAARPKLTVVIVAEQFRPDYLDRCGPSFSSGGFNRLLRSGSVFRNARYQYLSTFPASGAALVATGAYPERSGIVAEHWYSRQSRRVVSAVEDRQYGLVGSSGAQSVQAGASPRNLMATTLADQLRVATGGRSRTISISLREETAVLLGGMKPAGCYWLDQSGRFVTSSYYSDTLPGWVEAFGKARPALRFQGQAWKALGTGDAAPPLRRLGGETTADFLATYLASPFAAEEEFDFAREAATAEKLGEGSSGDLLIVSVSSLYLLGLETGADSPLMRDLVIRLDRKMDEFFSWLDARYGADQIAIAFTATQGLPDSPDALDGAGIHAQQISGDQIAASVNSRLTAAFGTAPGGYVEKYVFPWLYLREGLADRWADAKRLAGEAAMSVTGVAGYFAAGNVSSYATPETKQLLARCWFPGRSGDVVIAYQPNYSERFGDGRGVSPGSFYSYDTVVPILFYGPPFRAGVFTGIVDPADFTATLAAALDIPFPSSMTGHVLAEALKER